MHNIGIAPGNWSSVPPMQQQISATPQEAIQRIIQQIDRNSKLCKFRRIFYNKVDPADITKYKTPENIPDRQWEEAVENNPDPTCLVPVPAVGFQDLYKRIEVQNEAAAEHARILDNFRDDIRQLKKKHDLEISVKINECKHRQMQFESKLVNIMIKLELYRGRGQPINYNEEQWKSHLETCQKELNSPNQYKAKLNELISAVRMQEDRGTHIPHVPMDAQDVNSMVNVLEDQTKILTMITEDLKTDIDALSIMTEKYKEPLQGADAKYRNK